MIIGHIGVAFASRWRWPRIPVSWLIFATMAPDIARLALRAIGHDSVSSLYSHALPWSAGIALGIGLAGFLATRDVGVGLVLAVVVASHIGLDMISGGKELWRDGDEFGLGLQYDSTLLEFGIESLLLLISVALLKRTTERRWLSGWPLVCVLLAVEATYVTTFFDRTVAEQRTYAVRRRLRRTLFPRSPEWARERQRELEYRRKRAEALRTRQ